MKEGLLKIGWDLEEGRLIRKGLELEGRKVYKSGVGVVGRLIEKRTRQFENVPGTNKK